MRIVFAFILSIIVIGLFPEFFWYVLIINFAFGFLISALQIFYAYLPKYKPRQAKNDNAFFSVLVPAYNEPPEILIDTLHHLSRLNYQNFEVLVIDNNTKDEKIWRPVEAYCRSLGSRFKFFHVDPLSGFKAGALNYVMQYLDQRSEYLAVVDADYLVNPSFLSVAASYFSDKRIALVQFPQHYRNCSRENRAVADEYGHFFEIFMNMANHLDCVPSTGTVSAYRLEAVRRIGGWRGEMLTEDADIGLRLYGAGYKGVYVDEAVGYGLMPYDLESYRKQKWRWAFGNAQSIRTLFSYLGRIPFSSWIGFFSHLMAWNNFLFLPFAVLAAYTIILIPAVPLLEIHRSLLYLASYTIFLTVLTKYLLFVSSFKGRKDKFSLSSRAFAVHLGLTFVYSEAWISFMLFVRSPFMRTNKFISKIASRAFAGVYKEILLSLWFMIGAVEAMLWGRKFTVFAYFMTASMLLLILYIDSRMRITRDLSEKMIGKLREKHSKFLV